jgi:hypothetical protein
VTQFSYHFPDGNPCRICGRPPALHRITHPSEGNPCARCGFGENYHTSKGKPKRDPSPEGGPEDIEYLGIDGEGQGREDHRYIFLAVSSVDGSRRWSIDGDVDPAVTDTRRLAISTKDALNFILSIPKTRKTKIFAYAFQYDLTKILTDIDNRSLYRLFRPELRKRRPDDTRKGLIPIFWKGFLINLQASKFTVKKGSSRATIWDIFKFFQGRFVAAIQDWKVGTPELWERMARMKEQRADFDKLDWRAVQEYCYEECAAMAGLAKKLTEAHTAAGLKLKNYYGAGSSAEAMLTVMGVKSKIRPCPDKLKAIAERAFFGGRFENSVIGTISGTLYGYDISSAYPYELCFLPCLEHGRWEWTDDRKNLEGPHVVQALVKYKLRRVGPTAGGGWGPFPFREKDGSICFPISSGGGWVYREEYLVGERLWPNTKFLGAWVYKCTCDCQPFKQIPKYYAERVRIGKEGPGIVIKLGCNSCYGKLAQSVGAARFQSWLWAGMITSGTRAKLLEMVGLVKDRSSILMMATDGIVSREKIETPRPKDTGTFEVVKMKDGKPDGPFLPLGGWEEKVNTKGMFFARPGIYFPLSPTAKEASSVRGRGVGRKAILENWQDIVSSYERLKEERKLETGTVKIAEVSRFCGVKSSLSPSTKNGKKRYKRAYGKPDPKRPGHQTPSYGQWIVRPVDLSFAPMPKRLGFGESVSGHSANSLIIRKISQQVESAAYERALDTESAELKEAMDEVIEQPDGDFFEFT